MTVKILSIFSTIFILFFAGFVSAEEVPEVIEFEGSSSGGETEDVFPTTYSGPVTFNHLEHIEEFTDGCGECHHDDSHEPIESYDPDESYTCSDCHDEEGLIRGPIAENASTLDDLIDYRANVLHLRCIGCHKDYNAEQHVVVAPEACRICHIKGPQDWIIE